MGLTETLVFELDSKSVFKICSGLISVNIQGAESLSGHFATLCREFDFYEVKKILLFFKKKREILLIIFLVKSLQKEQNSTNLLL